MKRQPLNTAGMSRAEEAALWCMRLSEGELQPEEEVAFERWLAANPRNSEAFDEAVTTWQELSDANAAQEFLSLRLEALRLAKRRSIWSLPRAVQGLQQWSAVAAAVLVVIGVAVAGALWWNGRPATYETGIGERRVVALADGSQMSLDADTRVRVRYTDERRDFWLDRGRARFDVAKAPLRPFSVAAAGRTVVATGTSFSVELIQKQMRVVLYEGKVAVLDTSADRRTEELEPVRLAGSKAAAAADQLLTPGRQLIAATDPGPAIVKPADPVRTRDWETGQLIFAEEPLALAVERVNRYAKEKLEIGDPAAGKVLVSGVFTAGDTQAFVEGITAAFPLRVEERDGTRRLLLSQG